MRRTTSTGISATEPQATEPSATEVPTTKVLSPQDLIAQAQAFCLRESGVYREELFGVTDGKAIGTLVEHRFKAFLRGNYTLEEGNSAKGIDLPSVNTDIKVTSIKQPQSSCPYRDSRQKIYGLGYNLLLFVYTKEDDAQKRAGRLEFLSCIFIESRRTGDWQTTTGLRSLIDNQGNEDDVFAFLEDHLVPGDEVTLRNLAREIVHNPPQVGYLTVSNALQWRLQYRRVVNLVDDVEGITNILKPEVS